MYTSTATPAYGDQQYLEITCNDIIRAEVRGGACKSAAVQAAHDYWWDVTDSAPTDGIDQEWERNANVLQLRQRLEQLEREQIMDDLQAEAYFAQQEEEPMSDAEYAYWMREDR